jgi:hypothetical protein
MGERNTCTVEVNGSIPLGSTNWFLASIKKQVAVQPIAHFLVDKDQKMRYTAQTLTGIGLVW